MSSKVKSISPNSIRKANKLKNKATITSYKNSILTLTSLILLIALVISTFNLEPMKSLDPYLSPYLARFKTSVKPIESLVEEASRIAREQLRLVWDLSSAEDEVKAGNGITAEAVDDETQTPPELVDIPAASRSMDELLELMQEYTSDELAQMLNVAYRG